MMTEEELIANLEELLSESMESVIEREQSTFDRMAGSHGNSMILFGTGKFGKRTLTGLRKLGIEPLAFCDNNSNLWGKEIEGLIVLSPEESVRIYGKKASFVVTIWNDTIGHPLQEIKDQISALGGATVISFLPLYWKHSSTFLPYFALCLPSDVLRHREEIIKCAPLIEDDESRLGFYKNISARILSKMENIPKSIDEKKKFSESFFNSDPNDVFIDAGAFDGDTLRLLLKNPDFEFKEIISLEPDPKNFKNLNNYIEGLAYNYKSKIKTLEIAIGNINGTLKFEASGSEQAIISENGSLSVCCARLDDLNFENLPTLIKMDIEGAEPEAILGAEKIISEKNPPLLALSVYHQVNHLWEILLILHRLNKSYKFFFRPHAAGGWDYILYAVPKTRVRLIQQSNYEQT